MISRPHVGILLLIGFWCVVCNADGQEESLTDYEAHSEGASDHAQRGLLHKKERTVESAETDSEEEAGAEEQAFTRRDVHDSAMLIGAVLLVACLFYLVNWPDDDIRLYTYRILSSTMSIFSAVLMYQGINQFVEYFIEGCDTWVKCVIQYVHCSLYIACMQLLIAKFSSIICDDGNANLDAFRWTIAESLRSDYGRALTDDETKTVRTPDALQSVWIDPYGIEVPVSKVRVQLQERHRNMKCWATLMSHMSGFAAINAGGYLQHAGVFSSSPVAAFFPVIITHVILLAMFEVAICFRQSRFKLLSPSPHTFACAHLCRKYCKEAEDDVCALSGSFLAVQAARFAIFGALPEIEGQEEPEKAHSWQSILLLYCIGCMGVAVSISLSLLAKLEDDEDEDEREEFTSMPKPPLRFERLMKTISGTVATLCPWCLLFGTRAVFVRFKDHIMAAVQGQILLALSLSIFAGLAVFLLDAIDDVLRHQSGAAASTIIRIIITSLAVLIGFSWESSFDISSAAISSSNNHQRMCKFFLGTFVFFFLVPAWKQHILKKEMALASFHKNVRKVEKSYNRMINTT